MIKKIFLNISILAIFVAVSYLAWAAPSAQPSAQQYGVIINLAGKQRMLSQKMVKEVLFIYEGIDLEKNRENLQQTVELFTRTLDGLRDGNSSLRLPPTETLPIRAQLDVVQLQFEQVEFIFRRIIAAETPSYDAILELAEKNIFILENMDIAVEMFEQEARGVLAANVAFLGIEINLAGKQRMLTQKMAKEALLVYLAVDRRKNKKLLRETYTLFEKSLKGLKYGDDELGLPGMKKENIVAQLDVCFNIWNELKPVIEASCDIMLDKISKEDLIKMANLNVLLLDEMNRAVEMYELLAK